MSQRLNKVYSTTDPWRPVIHEMLEARKILDSLHSTQRISGAGGQLNYLTTSGNEWDATGSMGSTSETQNHIREFTVTWTGDTSQDFPTALLSWELYINDPTNPANRLTPVQYTWTSNGNVYLVIPRSGIVINDRYSPLDSAYLDNPHKYRWSVQLGEYRVPINYYFRAQVLASCAGTLEVESSLVF